MSNLQQRVLTGVVGIAALVAALYFSQFGYLIVFTGISLLCQWEFYSLLKANGEAPVRGAGMAMGVLLHLGCILTALDLDYGLALVWLVVPATAVYLAKMYGKDRRPFDESKPFAGVAYTFLGLLYTSVPFALFHLAVYRSHDYSWHIALGVLLLLWASDSGAYFAGRSLGRHKLFERVSPKKTWEGFAGGLLASGIVSGVLGYYFTDLSPTMWVAVMLVIVVFGTYGDLSESMFKRSLAIKDSGSILPGHGGFLDRFDGLLIALPLVAALLLLF